MKCFKNLALSAMLIIPAIAASPAWSADISVGVMGGYETSEYKGVDGKWIGLPMVMIDSEYFFLSGREAGAHFYQGDGLSLDFMIGIIDGFDPGDSDDRAVKRMNKRKTTMFAGVTGGLDTPVGEFSATVKGDVLGNSQSFLAELSYQYTLTPTEKFRLVPSVGLSWSNNKHNNYYYGVSAQESAKSGLNRYEAKSSFTPSAKLMGAYQLTDKISLMLMGNYTVLPSQIKDSPIVDRSSNWQVFGGPMYRF